MIDFINSGIIQEGFSLIVQSVVAGLSLSCIATALSWAVISVLKLLHKSFS